jgi:hypothetical protein
MSAHRLESRATHETSATVVFGTAPPGGRCLERASTGRPLAGHFLVETPAGLDRYTPAKIVAKWAFAESAITSYPCGAQNMVITPGGWTQASLGQAAEMGESYQRFRRDVASGVI